MSGNLNKIKTALLGFLLLFAAGVSAQTLSGTVTDNTGEPIIGASVFEDGVNNGVATDIDGNFTLTLKGSSKKIKVSYVGMKSQVVNVAGKSTVNVKLEDESAELNEVVVIGYGTMKKKDLTGSVASVSAKDIANVPVSSAAQAIQGKMAGVSVTQTEGSPDADVKIRVRGGGSLSQDNSPLYIVDGFPVSSISDIAPSDIETIDVLKDASSTAIYGARGANGVIIVTTKNGKEGSVQVNFGASIGVRKVIKEVGTLDPYNYALYQYEQKGESAGYGAYDDLDIYKSMSGNDWQDELFGRTGLQQIYNLSVSGGTKETKFNVSYSRTDDKSIMQGSDFTKDNINAKLNSKINKWLTLDFNARMSYQVLNGLGSGTDTNESNAANSIVNRTVIFRPVDPLSSDTDDEENSSSSEASPLERMNDTYKMSRRFRQNYNAGLTWKPWKGWTFRSEFGYAWYYNNTDHVTGNKASRNSKLGYSGQPQVTLTRDTQRSWRNSNTVTYEHKNVFFKNDKLNVLLGQEWSSDNENEITSYYVSFPKSYSLTEALSNLAAGTALPASSTYERDDNMLSFFGRLNYNIDDRYLFTATLRADGSSKFAKGNRWGYFPSAAFAWRISEEKFMKSTQKWLSNLKLRLSYGTAGNNRISSGLIDDIYTFSDATDKLPYFNETLSSGMQHVNLANSNLKWETTITRDLGIDFGFLKGRINGTFDVYWNTTKDLLMKVPITSVSGYSYQYQNFGQTSNKGFELAVNVGLVQKPKFTLDFNANISYNRNKIDKLNTTSEYQNYSWAGSTISDYETFKVVEGGRLGEIYGYKYKGFYTVYNPDTQTGDLVWNTTSNKWEFADATVKDNSYTVVGGTLVPGGIKLEVNESGTPQKQRLGNTVAPWTGGFGLSATFHGFDASIFCNYSLGNKLINGTKLASSFNWGSRAGYNLNSDFVSRYSLTDLQTGEIFNKISAKQIQQYNGLDNIYRTLNTINQGATIWDAAQVGTMVLTDYAVEDASFLRIQNVTIGYTLPKHLLKKVFLSSVRFYFTGYNLLTITGYSGSDPETDVSSKKNAMCPGIDYAAYPKSRLYVFGVNVTF